MLPMFKQLKATDARRLMLSLLMVEELNAERFLAGLRLATLILFGTAYILMSLPYNSDILNNAFIVIVILQLFNSILPNYKRFISTWPILLTIAIDALSILGFFFFTAREKSFRAAVDDEALVYLQIIFIGFQAVRFSTNYIIYAASVLLAGRFLIYCYFRFVLESGVSYEGSGASALLRYLSFGILISIFAYAASRAKLLVLKAIDEYLAKNTLLIENKELSELASSDGLTGLRNKRYLTETLPLLINEARHSKEYLSLAIIDLDDFKSANDSLGHEVGDDILKKTAVIMQNHLGEDELAVRYGGDEICLIFPGKNKYKARETLEKIRQAVEKEFKNQGKITLSVGIAEIKPGQKGSGQRLIMRADNAMYKSKNRGRNQIQVD